MFELPTILQDIKTFKDMQYNKDHSIHNGDKVFYKALENEISKHKKSDGAYFSTTGGESSFIGGKIQSDNADSIEENDSKDKEDEINKELILILQEIYNIIIEQDRDLLDLDDKGDILELDLKSFSNFLEGIVGEDPDMFDKYPNTIDDIIEKVMHLIEAQINLTEEKTNMTSVRLVNKNLIGELKELNRLKEQLAESRITTRQRDGEPLALKTNRLGHVKTEEPLQENSDQKLELNTKLINKEKVAAGKMTSEDVDVMKNEDLNLLTFDTMSKDSMDNKIINLDTAISEMDENELFEQLVSKAKLIMDANRQEIRIKLKPEILGELLLKVESVKGDLLAKVMVENYKVKELIEANLYQFKEDIKENGLDIKTFEVFVASDDNFHNNDEHQGLYFNKKSKQINTKNNNVKDIQLYEKDISVGPRSSYIEGTLNLFA